MFVCVGGQGFLSLFPTLPSQRALSFAGYRLELELAIYGPLTMVKVTFLLNVNNLVIKEQYIKK